MSRPPSFVFLSREIDYWVPMQFSPEEAATRGNHYLNVVARLKPGVSVEAADSDMRAIAKRLQRAASADAIRDLGAGVVSIREQVLGDTRVQVIALDDCGVRHRPHRVRQSREPAPGPRVGAPRRVRGAALARRDAWTAGAAGARRSAVPVACRRCAGPRDPGADHDVRRADRARWTAGDSRCRSWTGGCSRLPARSRSRPVCCSAWGRRCNRRTPRPRTCCSSTPAAMPADGAAHSATALVVLQVAATLVLLVAAGLMLRTLANLNATELGFDAGQPADDAGGAAAEVYGPEQAAGVLREHHRRRPCAARCAGGSVWLDASISGHRQHAILQCRGTSAPSWRRAGCACSASVRPTICRRFG